MHKYSNFAIVSSFFCLWITSYFSDKYQLLLGFLFIFSFGIMHGANDLVLIKSLNKSKKEFSFRLILIYYISIVALGIFAFYYFPLLALILFIVISGYHFGEQQWQTLDGINNILLKVFFQFNYGTVILFMLFNFHQQEVQNIIKDITAVAVPLNYLSLLLKFFIGLLLSQFLYLYMYHQFLRKQILLEIFYLLVFALVFLTSSLIWGFAIFFIIWHSIPSIIDQIIFLYNDVNLVNFKLYFKSAFVYWITSLFGIALLYWVFKEEKIFNAIFFAFLAAITFPHTIVILKMFNRK